MSLISCDIQCGEFKLIFFLNHPEFWLKFVFPYVGVKISLADTKGGEIKYRDAWKRICEISRQEFAQVYQRLGIHLEEKVVCPSTAFEYSKCGLHS